MTEAAGLSSMEETMIMKKIAKTLKLSTTLKSTKKSKSLLAAFMLLAGQASFAQGWSVAAVPTIVEVLQSHGFLVYGAFGESVSGCSTGHGFYVSKQHPQYNQIFSLAMSASISQIKVRYYSTHCAETVVYGQQTFDKIEYTNVVQLYNR